LKGYCCAVLHSLTFTSQLELFICTYFIMHSIIPVILATLAVVSASPIKPRVVAQLNEEAFKEAQPRDDTATRAFSATAITVSLW
jgi:hypothetical protein